MAFEGERDESEEEEEGCEGCNRDEGATGFSRWSIGGSQPIFIDLTANESCMDNEHSQTYKSVNLRRCEYVRIHAMP
jgi:hypothetical protein